MYNVNAIKCKVTTYVNIIVWAFEPIKQITLHNK